MQAPYHQRPQGRFPQGQRRRWNLCAVSRHPRISSGFGVTVFAERDVCILLFDGTLTAVGARTFSIPGGTVNRHLRRLRLNSEPPVWLMEFSSQCQTCRSTRGIRATFLLMLVGLVRSVQYKY